MINFLITLSQMVLMTALAC